MKSTYKYISLLLALIFPLVSFGASETRVPYSQVTQGTSTVANKDYIFDIGSGAANPRFRADSTTGKIRFANDGVTFSDVGTGSGSIAAVTKSIAQTAHGFSVGNIVYYTGSAYAKAKADALATSQTVGMVTTVTDANNFVLTLQGYVSGLSGLTAGSNYLSAATAGLLTSTEPSTSGQYSKKIFFADSTSSGYLFHSREILVGPTNVFGSWATFAGTVSCSASVSSDLRQRQEGENLHIYGSFTCGTAGTGTPKINLTGTGYTIKTSLIPSQATPKVGEWTVLIGGTQAIYNGSQEGHLFYDLSDNTAIYFALTRSAKAYVKHTDFSTIFGSTNTEAMQIDISVPIQ